MNPRVPRSRVSQDRWLVSYADFITLLFAFFVVLYAFAKADEKKQIQVSQAINSAFRPMGGLRETKTQIDGASSNAEAASAASSVAVEDLVAPMQVKQDLVRLQRELTQTLASQIASHAIALEMGRDGLVISLREAGFFESGSAQPQPAALAALKKIGAKLGASPYDVRIEGHTDNVPIHNQVFDSNWELSSARATRIARLFLETKAIPPDRISAAGYAEFHPIASNDTAEGRAQNRRVDLVVMPRTAIDFRSSNSGAPETGWRKVTDDE